jgi:hypothetical protein
MGAGNGNGSVFADSGRTRLESGGTALYPICEINSGWNEAEDAANARLIATAPELLDALRWALDQIDDDLDLDHQAAMNAARAAIQKATGDAQ